jgi:SAM-dependent methyltransferase
LSEEALSKPSALTRPADPIVASAIAEIEAEVRRILRDAEVSSEEVAWLDELFVRLAPERGSGGRWRRAAALMHTTAPVDWTPPLASRKPVGKIVKRLIGALTQWYLRALGMQVERFHGAVCTAVDELGAMVERSLEGTTSLRGLDAPVWALGAAPGGPSWWWGLATAACRGAVGRVLHAECGTGAFVEALLEEGIDAYGVDPRPVEEQEHVGLDVRQGDVLEHLRAVEEGSLGAVVLTGVIERAAPGAIVALVEQAARRLTPGGVLVAASASRAAFEREAPVALLELAPGRPLSADTWLLLLEQLGFEVLERQTAPLGDEHGFAVVARAAGAPVLR